MIFCLGGSTTEFTDSDGLGWPERTEMLLNKNLEKKVKIYNFGRQWYTTQHSLINFNANLRHRNPSIVIVMHAINDLLQNADFSYFSTGPFREDYGHFLGPVRRMILQPSLLSAASQSFSMFWYAPKRQIIDQSEFPGLESFKRNLDYMVKIAAEDGFTLVLMTQPFLMKEHLSPKEQAALTMVNREAIGPGKQWSLDTARAGMEQYNTAIRNIATNHNVTLFDLEKDVPKSLDFLYDDVHYTDRAFLRIADFVSQHLMQTGLVK